MDDTRKVEIMVAGVGWAEIDFMQLVEGDMFRLFESTGEIVMDDFGRTVFTATCDAYEHDGIGSISVDGFELPVERTE